MKAITILIMLFIGVTNIETQNEITANAVYDGYFEGTYSFTIEGEDEFVEETVEFDDIPSSILAKYDLKSEDYVGKHFSLTYIIKIEKMEDENGNEEEWNVYELKSLKKI
ncbi:MAG: hypothetical protein ACPGU9_05400 [Flavobacteriaceae bacterium]